MQTNRRPNSSPKSRTDGQACDNVDTIRKSLIELQALTADEVEFKTLTYLIGMALQEASTTRNA
jgi:hypothetical protein